MKWYGLRKPSCTKQVVEKATVSKNLVTGGRLLYQLSSVFSIYSVTKIAVDFLTTQGQVFSYCCYLDCWDLEADGVGDNHAVEVGILPPDGDVAVGRRVPVAS